MRIAFKSPKERNQNSSGFPWLKPTDFLRALHRCGRLDLALPEASFFRSCSVLEAYWSRYFEQFPEHEIKTILSKEQLKTCIPIKIHGDEGRSTLTLHFFC